MSDLPQDHTPQNINSVRMRASAPADLRRESRYNPPAPSFWNSRKTLDISTRAKCGGESSYLLWNHITALPQPMRCMRYLCQVGRVTGILERQLRGFVSWSQCLQVTLSHIFTNKLHDLQTSTKQDLRDTLAMQYMYKSSTQQ